ncbi:hypothetical protein HDU87_006935 [Geranomyces variabilis]|uniref:Uncharacterized protein n=1 Tax=Geranomyces variabilis TaxID=109894 RepID=A0AAD5TG97_9FUNG|nr:hypothetical protein HDU87_006935 [Geranomyces variabilis]
MQDETTVNELAEELSQLSTAAAPLVPEFIELSEVEIDVLAAAADTAATTAAAFPLGDPALKRKWVAQTAKHLDARKRANIPANTVRGETTWAKKWADYKASVARQPEEGWTVSTLAQHLESFIDQVKMDNGSDFKDSSLKAGIDALFRVRTILDRRIKDLQDAGRGGTVHSGALTKSELAALLDLASCSTDTARGLCNRVYLHVNYFLCNHCGDAYEMEKKDLVKKFNAAS